AVAVGAHRLELAAQGRLIDPRVHGCPPQGPREEVVEESVVLEGEERLADTRRVQRQAAAHTADGRHGATPVETHDVGRLTLTGNREVHVLTRRLVEP